MISGFPLDIEVIRQKIYGKMNSIPSALDTAGLDHAKKSIKKKAFHVV